MQAIEFNSQFEHGQITVPKTLHLAEGQPVRVLILLDETTAEKSEVQGDAKRVWERTAGTLSDDFPDEITDDDLGTDAPRHELD